MAEKHGSHRDTQLFLLRIWRDDSSRAIGEATGPSGETTPGWHGKVQHVVRAEAHAFAGWDMLITCLEAMLRVELIEVAEAERLSDR